MIQIKNINETIDTLSKVDAGKPPVWGKMTPQHMVEHLTMTIRASSGKYPIQQTSTPEEAEVAKARVIYSDALISMGVKSPLMGDVPPDYVNENLQAAIDELKAELQYFETYYNQNPDAMHTQPRMGLLKHSEWLIFHGKHFTHHFKQFELL